MKKVTELARLRKALGHSATLRKTKRGTFIAGGVAAEAVTKALYASGIEHKIVGVEFEVLPPLYTAEVAAAWAE